jgi:hypothetical protein
MMVAGNQTSGSAFMEVMLRDKRGHVHMVHFPDRKFVLSNDLE